MDAIGVVDWITVRASNVGTRTPKLARSLSSNDLPTSGSGQHQARAERGLDSRS